MKTKTFITALLSMLFVTTLFLGACDKEETNDGDLDYMTDTRDGQTYAIVKIGSQTWMVDNLNYNTNESWWYNNSSEKGDVYGRLYSWEAAMEA